MFPESDGVCKDVARLFLGGKGIRDFNECNRLEIEKLMRACQCEMKKRDSKNYRRNIENLAEKYGIACKDSCIQIYRKDSVIDEELPQDIEILGNMVVEYGVIKKKVKKGIMDESGKNESKNKTNFPELRFNTDKLAEYCPLYKDHLTEHLHHNLKFLLATNLRYIRGEKTLFMDGIGEEETETREKWEMEWKQIRSYCYKPQSCVNGGCPYADTCKVDSLYSKLSWKVIPLRKNEPYISLEEAQNELRQCLCEAVEAKDRDIHLIKAQTALGKTYAYWSSAS